jgi:hypothetical protein
MFCFGLKTPALWMKLTKGINGAHSLILAPYPLVHFQKHQALLGNRKMPPSEASLENSASFSSGGYNRADSVENPSGQPEGDQRG